MPIHGCRLPLPCGLEEWKGEGNGGLFEGDCFQVYLCNVDKDSNAVTEDTTMWGFTLCCCCCCYCFEGSWGLFFASGLVASMGRADHPSPHPCHHTSSTAIAITIPHYPPQAPAGMVSGSARAP